MIDREIRVLRVIECRPSPGGGVVAVLARGREELRLRGMAGVGGVVVVGLMATDARGWQRRVVIVDMAVRAHPRRYEVRTGKGEGCVVVIEGGICPDSRIVAEFACSWESGCTVRGIVRARIVVLVARVAQGTVQRIVIVHMAVRALPRRHGVISRQWETGTAVIEGRIGPRSRVVALIARLRKVGGNVIGICGPLKVLQMARYAGHNCQVVVVIYVAIGALPRWHGVIPSQRETRTVVIEGRIRP